jgi:hypothetical protein
MVPKIPLSLGKLIGANSETLAMEHLPNRSRVIGSNSTLLHFYYLVYFSDLHFLLTRIINNWVNTQEPLCRGGETGL